MLFRSSVNWRKLCCWVAWDGWASWHRWRSGQSIDPWWNTARWAINWWKAVSWVTRNWASWSHSWISHSIDRGWDDRSVRRNWSSVRHWRLPTRSWRKINRNGVASKTEDWRWWEIHASGHHWWHPRTYSRLSQDYSLWRIGWWNNWLVRSDRKSDDRVCDNGCWNIRRDVSLGDELGSWCLGLLWWHCVANSASRSPWSSSTLLGEVRYDYVRT